MAISSMTYGNACQSIIQSNGRPKVQNIYAVCRQQIIGTC